jgi:SM-20-related protein
MSEPWVRPTPLVVLDEFLSPQDWAGLLRFALRRRDRFTDSGILGAGGEDKNDYDYRRSLVLYDLGGLHGLFANRIRSYLPHVLARLRLPPFPISKFEIQLTATNDGQFFRQHKDDDSESVRTRVLTFVYYFYREPKAFRGGALQLYDAQLDQQGNVAAGAHQTVHPTQNQVVFFPSDCLHEVLPVECPSQAFSDSRFTLNGWVHR